MLVDFVLYVSIASIVSAVYVLRSCGSSHDVLMSFAGGLDAKPLLRP